MAVEPCVNRVLAVRIDGAEDSRENLKRQPGRGFPLNPKATRAEIGKGNGPEIFARYPQLFHGL